MRYDKNSVAVEFSLFEGAIYRIFNTITFKCHHQHCFFVVKLIIMMMMMTPWGIEPGPRVQKSRMLSTRPHLPPLVGSRLFLCQG